MSTPTQHHQGSTGLTESELMEAVAHRFYFDDLSKMQIGNEFGISRFRVARLLEKAPPLAWSESKFPRLASTLMT